jgi:hypothetical protein
MDVADRVNNRAVRDPSGWASSPEQRFQHGFDHRAARGYITARGGERVNKKD